MSEIAAEADVVARRYRAGGTLTFPMSTNIAVAFAPRVNRSVRSGA